MKNIGLNELRERYLKFFESKGHLRMESASLVPKDDASLLLTNSGMAPLKNYFLGLQTPPCARITTCQKCIRTPDIERVGKTSRHGTFFEMLGNFSFGDYFKEDATKWAWEFLTEDLDIPADLLYVSIYEDDDEAFDIWTKSRGLDPSKITRLGKEDNFWEIGSGPCGPCSEIYFDRGEGTGCGQTTCAVGCDCDRFVEIWNLVFTQFNSDGEGNYTLLAKPNIDTGMGLERLACVMQNVGNLFEVDTMQSIMKNVASIAGVNYKEDEKTDISLRVVTDHIRSTVFMIGDGIVPQNEGREYVLRRLLRRAARHGRLMGITEPFLHTVAQTVIDANKDAYPELTENAEFIRRVIFNEEERFARTLDQGMQLLDSIIDKLTASGTERVICGEDMFRLYDTFGFPPDLTREIALDKGFAVDEDGFEELMRHQRERAKRAREDAGGVGWEEDVLVGMDIRDNFIGYDSLKSSAEVLAIILEGSLVSHVSMGDEAILVLNETPFYSESGGQMGDIGTICKSNKNMFAVQNTRKSPTGHTLHIGVVQHGVIEKGDQICAKVDSSRRGAIMRNHTATHLLHAALRQVLGAHVHQSGSMVDGNVLRFDFTHFEAVTTEQLSQVEKWVNDRIFESLNISVTEMALAEARAKGAVALFGDKYGDIVRVVEIEGKSTELCGGTHVTNTAQIALFKILSESSVAAGVRRIEAVSGHGVLGHIKGQENLLVQVCEALRVNSISELVARAESATAAIKALQKEKDALLAKLAEQQVGSVTDNMVQIGAVRFVSVQMSGTIGPLREKADNLKAQYPDITGVFAAVGEEKIQILAFAGKDAVKAGIHCGNLVKEITAKGSGSGGGRPDNAMGAIPDAGSLAAVMDAAPDVIRVQLKL